ncbi:MAG: hypothetical protein QM831_22805 [Kofleriaceae bacterium]
MNQTFRVALSADGAGKNFLDDKLQDEFTWWPTKEHHFAMVHIGVRYEEEYRYDCKAGTISMGPAIWQKK